MTKVKFLIEEIHNPDFLPNVFAFFPDEKCLCIGAPDYDVMFTSYAHIGQHSACHIDYANECKEATRDEYLPLLNELKGIGYKLKVLNKIQVTS